jgi:hypothetical protein
MANLRTTPPRQERPGCFTILALIMFLVSGLLIHFKFFHDALVKSIRSRYWDVVPCEIIESKFEQIPRGDSYIETYKIIYRFKYHEKNNKSQSIWFIKSADSSHEDILRILEKYPLGKRNCYVDPYSDPEKPFSVLERGFKPTLLIDLLPLSMVLFSFAGLSALFIRSMTRKPDFERVDTRYCPSLRAYSNRRPIRLHSSRGTEGLATALLLAVGWNFTTYFLLERVAREWSAGIPGCHELILSAFALLMALIGLLLILLLVGMIIQTYNPHPRVKIESLKIQPGQEILIDWKIRGLRWFLKSLSITLEGREEATYLNHSQEFETAREVFYTAPLLSQNSPPRAGTTAFKTPAGPPSFTGKRNAVIWAVKFSFSLRFFPDVEDEMELTLLPEKTPC